MTHEICPECGKKTLRYRKRTKDYSCQKCPFEGDDAAIESLVAEAARRRREAKDFSLVYQANEHRERIGVYVDRLGPAKSANADDFPAGILTALVAVGVTIFVEQVVLDGSMARRWGFGALTFLGSWFALWLVLVTAVSGARQRRLDAAHEAEVAKSKAEHERWVRENPDVMAFRSRPFTVEDMRNPRVREFAVSLVPYFGRVDDDE